MTLKVSLAIGGVLLAASTAGIAVRAQTPPAPVLEIVAPGPDAYISGTTTLRATLTPLDAATR